MRAIFGLAGVLVAIGVIVWIMSNTMSHTQNVLSTGQTTRDQVNQIAGNDPTTGARASESADFQPLTTNGKLSGILVTRLSPGGAYERYFGLKRNDTITAVEYQGTRLNVREMDDDMAKAQISEAYQRSGGLVVVRDEKQLTLPQAPQPGQAQPAAAKSNRSSDPLQQQLDAIQNVPR